MKQRPDLLDENAPEGVEVVQLTDEDAPTCHIYMEAQVFTPDSKRLVLHRSAHAHGSDKHDAAHRYLLCDLDAGGALSPITDELGATAPSVSPDGTHLYYVIDELDDAGGRLTLRRVRLDGTDRRTLAVIDGFPGAGFRPALGVYPLSTIRSDGKRLAVQTGMRGTRDGRATFGLVVFDLDRGTHALIHHGPSWHNMHPQYSRSLDAGAMRDIMIQNNHGGEYDVERDTLRADIHAIRDDGSDLRDFPCGRDGDEHCHGHQCWRGRSTWAIIGTNTQHPNTRHLVECRAVAGDGHRGNRTPGGTRNMLSRAAGFPRTAHFGTDLAGTRLVTDAEPYELGGRILLLRLGEPGVDAAADLTALAWTRTADVHTVSETHPHPFLSPDGTLAFFNSNESGTLQAYMIRGLPAGPKR